MRAHLMSGAFLLIWTTALVLALLAANAGVSQYQFAARQQAHYLDHAGGLQDSPLSGEAIEPALRVVRPPLPGSVVVRGLERSRPAYWDFSPAGVVEGPGLPALDRRSESGPLFDFEAVVRVVFGLLAVLMGVRSVAGRRQDGTLQALLDLPLHRATIAVAKLAGAALALAVALGIMALATLALVWSREPSLVAGDLPAVVVLVTACALGYATVLVAFGMTIGSLAPSLTAAGAIGVGLWGLLALAYPQLVTFAAYAASPPPLRTLVEEEQATMYSGRVDSTLGMLGRTVAERHGERAGPPSLDAMPGTRELVERLWTADTSETRLLLSVAEERARDAELRHDRIVRWLSAASPSTLLTRIAAAIADAGSVTEFRWRVAVAAHHARLAEHLFDDPPRLVILVPSETAFRRMAVTRKPSPTASALPAFQPPASDIPARLRHALEDIAALAVFLAVATILATVSFPATGAERA
jgi:ABC-type transport system involved in multi-copper enzyme maturation permease subunit